MKEIIEQPSAWAKRFSIPSPVTGRCLPLTHIPNATLQLGAWGLGVALQPGNQRVHLHPDWECYAVSADRRDWSIRSTDPSQPMKAHLRIWAPTKELPWAFKSTEPGTLLTLAPEVFQQAEPCLLSLTLPVYPKLCWRAALGPVTAISSDAIQLYMNPILPERYE
ncbi:hypothetical protein CWE15_03845 [Aliidiomarina taiwanensis]|uniref:Uncharacterized protein n=1 Tax=Aliidiomarina taiwanensis TaxID=946228 RepID=A0A432XA85_9GAMM|nr:hypothetical protein [Aliidiomarina taiwanensis]RUO44313.1 hypothetical protein CWE15_03845 [Aliidiomarina taiwanensis]